MEGENLGLQWSWDEDSSGSDVIGPTGRDGPVEQSGPDGGNDEEEIRENEPNNARGGSRPK